MAYSVIKETMDYRQDWERYWDIEKLTPQFDNTRVRKATPMEFDDENVVLINKDRVKEGQQKFIGVIVLQQGINVYYLLDSDGDIWVSELLSNYDPDECIVHFESIEEANTTTQKPLEHDQPEGEKFQAIHNADTLQSISDKIESLSTDKQQPAEPDMIDKWGQEHQNTANLLTKIVQLKEQQSNLKETLNVTQERLKQYKEEITYFKDKLHNAEVREVELQQNLFQLTIKNNELKQQIENMKIPYDFIDTKATCKEPHITSSKLGHHENTNKISIYNDNSAQQLGEITGNVQNKIQTLNHVENNIATPSEQRNQSPDIKKSNDSVINISVIEQVCKSVVSPITEIVKGYQESDAQQVMDHVTMFLTAAKMRAKKGGGLRNVDCWIKQVENCTLSDPLRIQMVKLRADPDVLCLINKTENNLRKMTWLEVKALLLAKATKPTLMEATEELLLHAMTEKDDIFAFAAKLQNKYKETCQAFGVSKLKKSFAELLSFTVTCNMTKRARFLYAEAFKKDYEKTIKDLEEASRDSTYKKSLFDSSQNMKSIPILPHAPNRMGKMQEFQSHPPVLSYNEYSKTQNSYGNNQPFAQQAKGDKVPFSFPDTTNASIKNSNIPLFNKNQYYRYRDKRISSNCHSAWSNYTDHHNNYSQQNNFLHQYTSPKAQEILTQFLMTQWLIHLVLIRL